MQFKCTKNSRPFLKNSKRMSVFTDLIDIILNPKVGIVAREYLSKNVTGVNTENFRTKLAVKSKNRY